MTSPATSPVIVKQITKLIALAGLGTINGEPRTRPNENWTQEAWEDRVLECIPVAAEQRCRTLAEQILRLSGHRAGVEEGLRLSSVWTPSEAQWGGLARDIVMWLDMHPKTPRALFKHLERIGREIPQWLRDEPEMRALDHVPSKGTRCVIIWRAMLEADTDSAGESGA